MFEFNFKSRRIDEGKQLPNSIFFTSQYNTYNVYLKTLTTYTPTISKFFFENIYLIEDFLKLKVCLQNRF